MCPCEPTAQHRSHHQGVGHTLRLILYRALLNTQQQTDAVNTLQIVCPLCSSTPDGFVHLDTHLPRTSWGVIGVKLLACGMCVPLHIADRKDWIPVVENLESYFLPPRTPERSTLASLWIRGGTWWRKREQVRAPPCDACQFVLSCCGLGWHRVTHVSSLLSAPRLLLLPARCDWLRSCAANAVVHETIQPLTSGKIHPHAWRKTTRPMSRVHPHDCTSSPRFTDG